MQVFLLVDEVDFAVISGCLDELDVFDGDEVDFALAADGEVLGGGELLLVGLLGVAVEGLGAPFDGEWLGDEI